MNIFVCAYFSGFNSIPNKYHNSRPNTVLRKNARYYRGRRARGIDSAADTGRFDLRYFRPDVVHAFELLAFAAAHVRLSVLQFINGRYLRKGEEQDIKKLK